MDVAGLKTTASHRAPDVGYAGDVLPSECWQVLAAHPEAVLVDVRSHPEWVFSGHPDLSSLGKRPVLLSWRLYPDFELNAGFVTELAAMLPAKDTPVFFLCKVGGRSTEAAAAMTAQGYAQCFNVMYGFEGAPNTARQRGNVNGWKAEELPWVQA